MIPAATEERAALAANCAALLAQGDEPVRNLSQIVSALIAPRFKSLETAAAYFGFRRNYLYQASTGIRTTTISNYWKIAAGFGLSISDLLCTPELEDLHFQLSRPRDPSFRTRPRHSSAALKLRLHGWVTTTPKKLASPRQAALAFGVSTSTLARHCPEDYGRLVIAARRFRESRANLRRRALEMKIRHALATMSAKGEPISVNRISRRIGFVRNYQQTSGLIEKLADLVLSAPKPRPTSNFSKRPKSA
ncbi:MAG: hypothetical protein ACREKL_10360 [Chthoniobacterales bacterium]